MTTFTAAIGREIDAKFPNGEQFTKFDFMHIAEEFGKNGRSITYVFRDMEKRGGLRIAGEMKVRKAGTQPSKVYALVSSENLLSNSKYSKFSNDELRRELKRKEAHLNDCGIRLHEVLDGMTRSRCAEFER